MLACSVLIGTMLAAVLELGDKRSSLSTRLDCFLFNAPSSFLRLSDLCSYSDRTLSIPHMASE